MRRPILIIVTTVAVACAGAGTPSTPAPPQTSTATTLPAATTPTTTTVPTTTTTAAPTTTTLTAPTTAPTTTLPPGVTPPLDWLGTRPLPVDSDGDPIPQPTPGELSDRRFATTDYLPAPPDDRFHSSVGPVPDDVAARSTWEEACPVALEDLAYVTVSHWGFDELTHTGELIVAAEVADAVVAAFHHIFEAGFPIERMTITPPAAMDAEPTGDGNVTEAFVCRPVTGGSNWSQHALGLAVDINPFHNPYTRGDVIIPELAGDYLDRGRNLPGMIVEGDAVTEAFDDVGWHWGGRWSSLKDYQHFSRSGN